MNKRKLLKQLLLSAAARKRTKNNTGLVNELVHGKMLSGTLLTISLERFTTTACESVPVNRIFDSLNRFRAEMFDFLLSYPCIMTSPPGFSLQCLFAPVFSGDDFKETAAACAGKAIQCLPGIDPGRSGRMVQPQAGLATGEVLAGILHAGGQTGFTVIGPSARLSRRLAGELLHFGYPVLMDQATGDSLEDARVLDYYRQPGFTVVYKLYGYSPAEQLDRKHQDLYNQGLAALYLEESHAKAAEMFTRCLDCFPADIPSKQMLDRCRLKPGAVKMRGFR